MDNLCHTLVGAALARAGLGRRTPLATATLMIGANFPDIDAIAMPLGTQLTVRRGITHGVLALVVLPFVLTGLVMAYDRFWRRRRHPEREPVRPAQLLLLSALSILTHPFLDWMNTYGMRWLMPFDGTWFYADTLFIIDLWMWLSLGAGYLIARRLGRPWPARTGLATAAVYIALMMMGSEMARRSVVAAMGPGFERSARTLMVGSHPIDPTRRAVVVADGDRFRLGEYGLAGGELRWTGSVERVRADDEADVARAREMPAVRDFLSWARFPYYIVRPVAEGTEVVVGDARYGSPDGSGWASVRVVLPRS